MNLFFFFCPSFHLESRKSDERKHEKHGKIGVSQNQHFVLFSIKKNRDKKKKNNSPTEIGSYIKNFDFDPFSFSFIYLFYYFA